MQQIFLTSYLKLSTGVSIKWKIEDININQFMNVFVGLQNGHFHRNGLKIKTNHEQKQLQTWWLPPLLQKKKHLYLLGQQKRPESYRNIK